MNNFKIEIDFSDDAKEFLRSILVGAEIASTNGKPAGKGKKDKTPEPEPGEEEVELTFEVLRDKATEIADTGKRDEVKAIVKKVGKGNTLKDVEEKYWEKLYNALLELEGEEASTEL